MDRFQSMRIMAACVALVVVSLSSPAPARAEHVAKFTPITKLKIKPAGCARQQCLDHKISICRVQTRGPRAGACDCRRMSSPC
jgi:hypothetical protein